MARIRTIKPKHVEDKELANISLQAHLLWVLSWCFSDDEGIFENDSLLIKSQLFPRRTDVRVEQIDQWLGQLVTARFIIPFTYNGGGYYIHRTFKTHQKIDKPQPSKIPSEIIRGLFATDQRTVANESAVLESRGEESKGRGEERAAPPSNENDLLTWSAEEEILKNQIQFERIVMNSKKKNLPGAKIILHKYHLWLTEKDKYPMKRKAVFAGFEKWLMNENQTDGAAFKKSFAKNDIGHVSETTSGPL